MAEANTIHEICSLKCHGRQCQFKKHIVLHYGPRRNFVAMELDEGRPKQNPSTFMQSAREKTWKDTGRNFSSQVAFSASSSDGNVCSSHCSYPSLRRLQMHVEVGESQEK